MKDIVFDNCLKLILLLLLMVSQCSCDFWSPSYRYLMADFARCERENPDVVMWVQGRASNPTRRAVIRELLANNKAWPRDIRVLTFFMVGTFEDPNLQARLQYEFELYRDIVQNDYIEHYKNQTAKMISAINFLSDYCGRSKLALRIDDDVIFHPATMFQKVVDLMTRNTSNPYNQTEDYHNHSQYIKSYSLSKSMTAVPKDLDKGNKSDLLIPIGSDFVTRHKPKPSNPVSFTNQNTILCHILGQRKIIRPNMKRTYPVDFSVLAGETIYPDFCAGFFIAMSTDLLPKFQQLFAVEPPFWIDDSYLGVLQRRLKTVNVNANKLLYFNVPKTSSLRELISDATDTSAIAVHLMQGEKYYKHLARSTALDDLRYYMHL